MLTLRLTSSANASHLEKKEASEHLLFPHYLRTAPALAGLFRPFGNPSRGVSSPAIQQQQQQQQKLQ